MSKNVLEMKNISKQFSGVTVLNNVNLNVHEGEILALVGENGAGKSTLMKILSGVYPANSYDGEIFIDGAKIGFANPRQAVDAGIAMIYQELNLHLSLSVAENIFMGNWRKTASGTIDWKEMNRQAAEAIELVKLGSQITPTTIVGNLSASQQQLISIANSLVKHPKILVLDEPTSSLTKTEASKLFKILVQFKEDGITSILISHKLDEVMENSDRVAVLRDGNIISITETSKTNPETVVSNMIGRTLESFYPENNAVIGEEMLRVEDISIPHHFNKNLNIVEDIHFSVRKGEIFGLCGLVGAGRSELANAIYGKIKKKSGKVFLEGKEISIRTPQDALKHGISLVTEERKHDGIVGMLSIHENMTLSSLKQISRNSVINRKKEYSICQEFYDKLQVHANSLDMAVRNLSGGNQQKIVLGKCLMTQPKVLILDEPTRGIDVGTKYEIYKIMVELACQGIAIIMISSEFSELLSMCDNLLVIANGKQVATVPKSDFNMESIMDMLTRASLVKNAQ